MSEQDATGAESDDREGGDETDDAAEEPAATATEEPTDEEVANDEEEANDEELADDEQSDAAGESDGGDPSDGSESDRADDESPAVDEELVDRVAETDPEEIAREIDALRSELDSLEDALDEREAEIEDLEGRLKRKQADFQNYKRRQKERLEEEKRRATEDLVRRLLDVRDNLGRALEQDDDADIRGGVESTLRQFDAELDKESVEPIEPEPGEDIDPQRHEALATIASDQPSDTVAEVHRPGYEMAGKVVRPAQVAVSDGSGDA